MWISSDGRWLFATGIPNGNNYFPLAYIHVGQPFTNAQLYDFKAILSEDEQTLFYTSIDSAGLRETYNFLDLASGQRVELLSIPLPNAGTMEGMMEYIIPVAGWMPGDQPFIFTAYRGDIATGLYQIDLSGIDFTKSGQYPMPQPTQLMAFDRDVGGAIFSPDKKYILYIQADSQGQSVGYTDVHANILNRETGSVQTIPVENGNTIGSVEWRPNGTLIYLAQREHASSFQVYGYDPIRQLTQRIPLKLAGDSDYIDAAICGNTLFYTANAPENIRSRVLYSARLDAPPDNQLLYVADSININSCAPDSSWNPGKVATCVPFFTPTPNPMIGDSLDIQATNLNGGDPVQGQVLYSQFGCVGCHQNAAIAPPMTGVYTRVQNERLADPLNAGKTPEQYLAESILQPDAYIVPHYLADLHPKHYSDQMSLGDLRDLIAYLMTQT